MWWCSINHSCENLYWNEIFMQTWTWASDFLQHLQIFNSFVKTKKYSLRFSKCVSQWQMWNKSERDPGSGKGGEEEEREIPSLIHCTELYNIKSSHFDDFVVVLPLIFHTQLFQEAKQLTTESLISDPSVLCSMPQQLSKYLAQISALSWNHYVVLLSYELITHETVLFWFRPLVCQSQHCLLSRQS